FLHAEHNEIELAWIDVVRCRGRKRTRKVLRGHVEQRLPAFNRESDDGPFAINQVGRWFRADERNRVAGHQELGREQRAVGGAENEYVSFHDCILIQWERLATKGTKGEKG